MLTDKQENFARAIALDGMNQSDAYRSAYNTENMSESTIWNEAYLLASHREVSKRINELRTMTLAPKIMTAQERLAWLTEIIKSEEETTRDKLSASDQMNKMQGEYVQKIEAAVDNNVTINIELSDD
jgi:hypothetical protein